MPLLWRGLNIVQGTVVDTICRKRYLPLLWEEAYGKAQRFYLYPFNLHPYPVCAPATLSNSIRPRNRVGNGHCCFSLSHRNLENSHPRG